MKQVLIVDGANVNNNDGPGWGLRLVLFAV
jgi:hypothetical protein